MNDDGQPRKSRNNHPCQAKKAKSTHDNLPLLCDGQDSVDEDYMDTEASEGSDSSTDEDEEMVITHAEVWNYKL